MKTIGEKKSVCKRVRYEDDEDEKLGKRVAVAKTRLVAMLVGGWMGGWKGKSG